MSVETVKAYLKQWNMDDKSHGISGVQRNRGARVQSTRRDSRADCQNTFLSSRDGLCPDCGRRRR